MKLLVKGRRPRAICSHCKVAHPPSRCPAMRSYGRFQLNHPEEYRQMVEEVTDEVLREQKNYKAVLRGHNYKGEPSCRRCGEVYPGKTDLCDNRPPA